MNSTLGSSSPPLMTAVNFCPEAVPLLLRRRSLRIHARDAQGETALTLALEFRRLDEARAILAAELQRRQSAREPGARLLHAALRGDVATVATLLAAGVSPEATEPQGPTPLIGACLLNQRQVVFLLLQQGARIDAIFNENQTGEATALQAAFEANDPEIARMVLKAGGTRFPAKAIESVVVRSNLQQLRQLRACPAARDVSPQVLRLAYDLAKTDPELRKFLAEWLRWVRAQPSPPPR